MRHLPDVTAKSLAFFLVGSLLTVTALRAETPREPLPLEGLFLPEALEAPLGYATAADRKGRLYSFDRDYLTVTVFDDEGRVRDEVELRFLLPPPQLWRIDVSANGRIWAVANPTDLYVFEDDGQLLRHHQLTDPRALAWNMALDETGSNLYVSRAFGEELEDVDNTILGRVDDDGEQHDVAFELTEEDEDHATESFRRTLILDVADDGRIWAAESGRYEFWELTAGGRILTHLSDPDVEADFTIEDYVPDPADLPRNLAVSQLDTEVVGTQRKLISELTDFEVHGGLVWILAGKTGETKRLDVVDPSDGTLHTFDLPGKPQDLVVTDRFVVLGPGDPGPTIAVLDRRELLHRIEEARSASPPREIVRSAVDPDEPDASLDPPASSTEENQQSETLAGQV